jgi:hypothetical protein
MRYTIVFLGVIISGILTWFGYALLASLISDDYFRNCLGSDNVITFFFATGWILPLLVGYDLYRHLYRNELRREKRVSKEISMIKSNTSKSGESYFNSSLRDRMHLN